MLCVSLEKSRCGCHLPVVGWDALGAAGVGCASAAAVSIACLQGCKYFTSEKNLQTKTSLSPGGTASSGIFGLFISAFSEPRSAAEQLGSASRAGALTRGATRGSQGPQRAVPGNSSPAQPGAPRSRSEAINKQPRSAGLRRVVQQRGAPHCLEPAAAGDPQPGAELCSRCGADPAWRSGTGCRRGLPAAAAAAPLLSGSGGASAGGAEPPPPPPPRPPRCRAPPRLSPGRCRAGPGRTLSPLAGGRPVPPVPPSACRSALSLTSPRCGSAAAAPGAGPAEHLDMASTHTEEPLAEDTADHDAHIYEEVMFCEKMEHSQRLAVEELITTEASYVHNLQLCLSDIRAHLQKKQLPGLDLEGLFSNIDDILHVSRRFLRGLQDTATQEHEQLLSISTLFQEFKEEMEMVYKIYCASYEHALLLVESYRKDPRLQEEIMDTLTATVPHTSASDLSFFLVMPVQRVTKYPLLLGKILENTPASTSTHAALDAAVRAMTQVNANINEYKRRREVATKYNKAEQLTLRDRFARLNTHSIAKKTTRLSRLLMHEAGIVAKTEDKEYDDLEEKFQNVASSVAALKENMASYLQHLEAFLLPTPHKCELQMEEGPAQQYRRLTEHLHRAVFPEFRRRLDRLVWQPLCSLAEMLVGPQQLVKKRLDKLLDYEEIQERKSETGSVTYDEEAAMNTYLAINALLVAELPRFNQVAMQLLGQLLGSFIVLQQDLAAEVLHEAKKELEQMPHGHMLLPAFWRMVEDSLQQSGVQLRTFIQAFETVTPNPVPQPLNPAEERKVLSLVSKHGPDKLYQVTSNINGSKDMDLTLQRGQIVALLQSVDTKGNTGRWLVDAGGPRGFVPAAKLQPYCPGPIQQPRMQMPALESGTERRRHSYVPPEAPKPQVATFTPAFQVVAGFSFTARSPQELSLQAGQPVVVLEPHDKKGSTEWSLVEVNGQRGYVPSSYLLTVPVQEPAGWSLPV